MKIDEKQNRGDDVTIKMGHGMDENKKQIYGANLLEEKKTEDDKSAEVEESRYLSKSDILLGKDQRETVFLDKYGKDAIIRPLTDGELTLVFELIGKVPLNEHGIPDLNLVDISTNLRALRKVASMGLVEPKLTEEEIGNMKFGVPGFLAKRILEMSGLTGTAGDDAKNFR